MKRRAIVNRLSQGAIAATGVAIVGGCQKAQNKAANGQTDTSNLPTIKWQMATSWPTSLETIFGGAQVLAERVKALTNGKFVIEPRAAGEIAPGLEVLNVVSQGAVQAGHTSAYYYIGKSPALGFGTSVPFGLNAQQQNAWLYEGGG